MHRNDHGSHQRTVAAGTPPDVCVVATEGAQLFAERLAEPLDEFIKRDAAEVQLLGCRGFC